MAAILMGLLASGGAVWAQERPITPEVLLGRIEGRTMAFVDRRTGAVVGYERFLSRSQSQWRDENGKCVRGDVYVEGPTLCFRYEDEPSVAHCWLPFKEGPDVGYRSTLTGEVQLMRDAEPADAECEIVPLS
ncbi:hypothetical protein [Jannaschia pohangensis]|uniref:hypothetical protein n=1 Tax=Jannaschia pohangensis TaxID=390807 RepID=UPI001C313EF4|nr:hypothetical protein [Jannaschia pohangensis]